MKFGDDSLSGGTKIAAKSYFQFVLRAVLREIIFVNIFYIRIINQNDQL